MFAALKDDWRLLFALFALSCVVGLSIHRAPEVAVGLAATTLLLGAGILAPGFASRVFLGSVGVLLVGYAFFGRPFAYLGVSPIFVGEVTLALGLFSALLDRERWAALRSPLSWLLIAFALWGAARTIPFLPRYGMDALRDAVVWGYGLFALLLVPVVLRPGFFATLPERYARILPWFLLWVPIAIPLRRLFLTTAPDIPGTDVSILAVKPGDFGVHLAGAAAFLLLGLHRASSQPQGRRGMLRIEWLWWTVWLCGFLVVGTANRGGMLAALAGIAVVMLLRPGAGGRRVVLVGAVLVAFTSTLLLFDVSLDFGGKREISARQLAANVVSIVGPEAQSSGTRNWRLAWWGEIVDYTVFGEHFLTGKGFGVNLANDDGFQVRADEALRSPHNGHLTILARTGVPGLLLWTLLQLGFAVGLVRASIRARRTGREWWARMNLWILAYWAGFMVNATFDVYLEGPQGGIWFWCLFGLGVAALLAQRRPEGAHPAPR